MCKNILTSKRRENTIVRIQLCFGTRDLLPIFGESERTRGILWITLNEETLCGNGASRSRRCLVRVRMYLMYLEHLANECIGQFDTLSPRGETTALEGGNEEAVGVESLF
jgi:hypothetical protein